MMQHTANGGFRLEVTSTPTLEVASTPTWGEPEKRLRMPHHPEMLGSRAPQEGITGGESLRNPFARTSPTAASNACLRIQP